MDVSGVVLGCGEAHVFWLEPARWLALQSRLALVKHQLLIGTEPLVLADGITDYGETRDGRYWHSVSYPGGELPPRVLWGDVRVLLSSDFPGDDNDEDAPFRAWMAAAPKTWSGRNGEEPYPEVP